MCGILGGSHDPRWDYQKAVGLLTHRGPDDQGFLQRDACTLAFRRLSIIDLSHAANQPMSSQDGQVALVFNGEIYDFMGLRGELSKRGHQFRTHSDTEVLLEAYLEWNDSFIEHVDGMFAVAIWDLRVRKLKLWRDRVGIKPLYYFFDGKGFAFSSELKGITTLVGKEHLDYDHTALYDYLTYLYIPDPKTLYKNIFKLPPGYTLIFDSLTQKITDLKPYWKLQVATQHLPLAQASERLRKLIHKSVNDQMIADVPVGFFLSGGMDSSSVVAEAAKISTQIKTFTIGFEQATHNELDFARLIAEKIQADHHEQILSNTAAEGLLARFNDWFDEPFADTSALPTYLVAQFARKKVTVVLTGDGGDEIFGGYRWYLTFRSLSDGQLFKKKPLHKILSATKSMFPKNSLLFKALNHLEFYTTDDLECYAKLRGGMTDLEKQPYAQRWAIPKDYDSYWHYRMFYRKDLPVLGRLQYLDFHTYLPGDILTKVDRASMAVSLEARVPLLSKEIIEFCFSLPESVLYPRGELKGLLKAAYQSVLPAVILGRDKKGFSIPKQYLKQYEIRKQERILKEAFKIE
jgi:asparagine synthase (glutamine-hydrolysing)